MFGTEKQFTCLCPDLALVLAHQFGSVQLCVLFGDFCLTEVTFWRVLFSAKQRYLFSLIINVTLILSDLVLC